MTRPAVFVRGLGRAERLSRCRSTVLAWFI